MEKSIHLAGISGSLRQGSFNTLLLKTAVSLLPDDVSYDIISVADLPLYNADLDIPASSARPGTVQELRDRLTRADGLIIASPEYNYSIPGGLKNALDWASRGQDSPLIGKPVALMGASPGLWGTVRMQSAFLPVFQYLDMKNATKPEILLSQANTKFSENGELTGTTAIGLIRQKLELLIRMCRKEKE